MNLFEMFDFERILVLEKGLENVPSFSQSNCENKSFRAGSSDLKLTSYLEISNSDYHFLETLSQNKKMFLGQE